MAGLVELWEDAIELLRSGDCMAPSWAGLPVVAL